MTRTRLLLVVGIVLGISAISAWLLRRDDNGGATALVTRGRIEQTIETTGVLQPVNPAVATATVSGTMLLVGVRPGDHVVVGDIIAQIDREPFQRAVDAAEQELETAELTLTLAEAEAADGDVEAQGEALIAAQRVEAARAARDAAQRALDSTTVLAPGNGTVLDVQIRDGQPYQAGAPIATVNVDDALQVSAELDEVDVPRVPVGTPVRITIDAFPATELTGRVASIAPQGVARGGGVVFPATIAVDDFSGVAARPGMTVSLAIPSAVVEEALLVPADAITTVGRRSFVTVLRDGDEVSVEVTTGLRSGNQVEIAAGDVQPGERVRLQR